MEHRWYEKLLDYSGPLQRLQRDSANLRTSKGVANILLYKLIDVAEWIKYDMTNCNIIERGSVPDVHITVSPFTVLDPMASICQPSQGWDRLAANWYQFLIGTSNIVHLELSKSSAIIESLDTTNVTLRHMHSLCQRQAKLLSEKFTINVQLTAVYLSYLIKVFPSISWSQSPLLVYVNKGYFSGTSRFSRSPLRACGRYRLVRILFIYHIMCCIINPWSQ